MDVTSRVLDSLEKLNESVSRMETDIALIQKDLQYHIRRTDLNEDRLNALEKIVKQWRAIAGGAMLSLAASHPQLVSLLTNVVTKVFG